MQQILNNASTLKKEKRGLLSILWQKYLDRLYFCGGNTFFFDFLKISLFFLGLLILAFPKKSEFIFLSLFFYKDFLILKGIFLYIIIMYSNQIFLFLKKSCGQTFKIFRKYIYMCSFSKTDTLEGVKIKKIVDFLTKKGGWKRHECVDFFGFSVRKYERIAECFEKMGILEKSKYQKNARILTFEFSEQEIFGILRAAGKTVEIMETFVEKNLQKKEEIKILSNGFEKKAIY